MEQPDYFIKDEGEFLTIGFKTQKAKDAIKTAIENQTGFVGNNKEIMLNQLNEIFEMCISPGSKNNFISWAISHNLSGKDF